MLLRDLKRQIKDVSNGLWNSIVIEFSINTISRQLVFLKET